MTYVRHIFCYVLAAVTASPLNLSANIKCILFWKAWDEHDGYNSKSAEYETFVCGGILLDRLRSLEFELQLAKYVRVAVFFGLDSETPAATATFQAFDQSPFDLNELLAVDE